MSRFIESVADAIPTVAETSPDWAAAIAALAAVFSATAALIALAFSIKQARSNALHSKLLTRPYLAGQPDIDNKGAQYVFSIENNGLGPAIITDIQVIVDDVHLSGPDHNKFIESGRIVSGMASHYYFETFSVGDYISAGKTLKLYRFTDIKGSVNEVGVLWETRVRLIIRYQSILGEEFTFDSRNINFKTPYYR